MGCSGSKNNIQDSQPGELDTDNADAVCEASLSAMRAKAKELAVLKAQFNDISFEKYGLEKMVQDVREELFAVSSVYTKAKEDYDFLLRYAMERDADDVYRALQSSSIDKSVLIDILTARTKWQLEIICQCYEEKHGVSLIKEIQKKLTTSLGVLTGSQSGLGRLLLWVCTDQPERDSHMLDNYCKDMEVIIEIVTTRSNRELHAALESYKLTYGKPFMDVIRAKAYKNFANLMEKVLECKRDESGEGYDYETARVIAAQLDHATAKKDAVTFITIFANMSHAQFESLNAMYTKHGGVIESLGKFSGDFNSLLMARCTDRLRFLCFRLSTDKESIPRILGCLSRKDCQTLRELFDENQAEFGHGKGLCEVLREIITKESYLTACLNLVSNDTHLFPLGVDREAGEDEKIIDAIGTEERERVTASYDCSNVKHIGEAEMARLGIAVSVIFKKPSFHINKKAIMESIATMEEEMVTTRNQMAIFRDEIAHFKELYFTVSKHVCESRQWTDLFSTYVEMLHKHIARKDTAAARAVAKRKGKNNLDKD